ncbi:lysylphosphatidylglycerol synthase domain-containing protein [Thiomicrorhabdus xiamenensis]|uniref:Flippase-like domain-containing protein n=1 Tax=Thiomicrorhabdus xiamenensis TaxID=2739063 RepID=A0A7D4T091_9GAMM|nr:lysylphosphatidylglycerol synthase domain-containing protein [Thiomicrorhabdus xiamenensis]QKI88645.1 flippase-like domain-containing protein [Thiomicrorhabdus xiamenensis]
MTTKKTLLLSLSLLVSVGLIWAIDYFLGWSKLIAPWTTLSIVDALLALSLLISSYAIRATRIYQHFYMHGIRDFLISARLMVLHNFWNNLLPMRSGEASFPLLMKTNFGMPVSTSVPALLWMRLMDLQVLLLIALLTLGSIWLSTGWILAFALAGLSAPFMIFWVYNRWLRKRQDLPPLLIKIFAGLPNTISHIAWGLFWTVFNWAIKIAVLAWVLSWFIQLPVQQLLMGVIGGEFSSVLPIHGIAGMGSYEAGVIIGFGDGFTQLDDLLVAAVNLHLILFSSSLLAAALVYLIFPSKKNKNAN